MEAEVYFFGFIVRFGYGFQFEEWRIRTSCFKDFLRWAFVAAIEEFLEALLVCRAHHLVAERIEVVIWRHGRQIPDGWLVGNLLHLRRTLLFHLLIECFQWTLLFLLFWYWNLLQPDTESIRRIRDILKRRNLWAYPAVRHRLLRRAQRRAAGTVLLVDFGSIPWRLLPTFSRETGIY